jgi:hypothetical protein
VGSLESLSVTTRGERHEVTEEVAGLRGGLRERGGKGRILEKGKEERAG